MSNKFTSFLLTFVFTFLAIAVLSGNKVKAEERSVFLYPYEDAVVFSGTPTTNYGSIDTLENSYVSTSGYTKLSLLKFDVVPRLHSSAVIQDAKLWVYLTFCENAASPNEMRVGQVRQNWTESTITWNSKPSFIPGVPRTATCNSGAWWGFDVTGIVQNWAEGQTNYGLIMYGPANGSWSRHFYSREYGGSTKQPQLAIYYEIPEPPPADDPDEEPPADEPPADDPDDGSGDQGLPDDDDTGIDTPPDPAGPSDDESLPANSSVLPPSLLYVYRSSNGTIAEENEFREISVNTDEDITVVGIGKAGQKIVLFIADKTYSGTVNSLGYWAITVDTNDLGDGSFSVEAQSQENGKGSTKIFFFNLNSSGTSSDDFDFGFGDSGDWESLPIASPIISSIGSSLFCLLILCCCPILLILFLLVIIKMFKGGKKPAAVEPVKPIEPAAAEAQPETVSNSTGKKEPVKEQEKTPVEGTKP